MQITPRFSGIFREIRLHVPKSPDPGLTLTFDALDRKCAELAEAEHHSRALIKCMYEDTSYGGWTYADGSLESDYEKPSKRVASVFISAIPGTAKELVQKLDAELKQFLAAHGKTVLENGKARSDLDAKQKVRYLG